MELNSEQLTVLNIFKAHDIGKQQFLPAQILKTEQLKLPEDIRKNWLDIIEGLSDSGYLLYDPLGYGLTEKGHMVISRESRLQQAP